MESGTYVNLTVYQKGLVPGLISDDRIRVFDGALSACTLSAGKNPDSSPILINPNQKLGNPWGSGIL